MNLLDKNKSISFFVVDWFGIGGSQTYVRECMAAAEKLQQKVYFILIFRGQKPKFPKFKFIKLVYLPLFVSHPWSFFERLILINRHLNLIKTDLDKIVITDYWVNLLVIGLVAKFKNKLSKSQLKLKYQFHGWKYQELSFSLRHEPEPKSFWFRISSLFERWVVRLIPKKVYCFSRYALRLLTDKSVFQAELVRPGPTLILEQKFSRSQAKVKLGFHPKTKLVLLVSRLEKRKGLEHFFSEIVPQLPKNLLSKLKFLVATNISSNLALEKFTQSFKSADVNAQTYWLHQLNKSDLMLAYQAADLVVMPSIALETFGFVATEAIACGATVLAYSIGALPEILSPTSLVARNKPKIFADRLVKILKHSKFLQSKNPNFQAGSWQDYLQDVLA